MRFDPSEPETRRAMVDGIVTFVRAGLQAEGGVS